MQVPDATRNIHCGGVSSKLIHIFFIFFLVTSVPAAQKHIFLKVRLRCEGGGGIEGVLGQFPRDRAWQTVRRRNWGSGMGYLGKIRERCWVRQVVLDGG